MSDTNESDVFSTPWGKRVVAILAVIGGFHVVFFVWNINRRTYEVRIDPREVFAEEYSEHYWGPPMYLRETTWWKHSNDFPLRFQKTDAMFGEAWEWQYQIDGEWRPLTGDQADAIDFAPAPEYPRD